MNSHVPAFAHDYVELAIRTEAPFVPYGSLPCIPMEEWNKIIFHRPDKRLFRFQHASLGMQTEVGELFERLLEWCAARCGENGVGAMPELDTVNVLEEVGDVFWYVAIFCHEFRIDFPAYLGQALARARQIEKEHCSKRLCADALVLRAMLSLNKGVSTILDQLKRRLYYSKLNEKGAITYVEPKWPVVMESFEVGLAGLCVLIQYFNLDLHAILTLNIDKLAKRYPEKFDSYLAQNRNLAAERVVLEANPKAVAFVDTVVDAAMVQPVLNLSASDSPADMAKKAADFDALVFTHDPDGRIEHPGTRGPIAPMGGAMKDYVVGVDLASGPDKSVPQPVHLALGVLNELGIDIALACNAYAKMSPQLRALVLNQCVRGDTITEIILDETNRPVRVKVVKNGGAVPREVSLSLGVVGTRTGRFSCKVPNMSAMPNKGDEISDSAGLEVGAECQHPNYGMAMAVCPDCGMRPKNNTGLVVPDDVPPGVKSIEIKSFVCRHENTVSGCRFCPECGADVSALVPSLGLHEDE